MSGSTSEMTLDLLDEGSTAITSVAQAEAMGPEGIDPSKLDLVGNTGTAQPSGWDFGPLSDGSIFVDQSDGSGGIFYEPVTGSWFNTETNKEYGQAQEQTSGKIDIEKWLSENKNLAGLLGATGGSLLKGIAQAKMMEDQREWMAEQKAEERAYQDKKEEDSRKRRAFAEVKPMNTGLYAGLLSRKQGVA